MNLTSIHFQNQGMIDKKYTCDGQDISPQLQWREAPAETKSFALTCIDPDAPGGDFVHWIVINIPKTVTTFREGEKTSDRAQEIRNSFGQAAYGGPCPPSGTHRYFFTVYALDVERLQDVDMNNFRETLQKHSLDSAHIVGLYKRS